MSGTTRSWKRTGLDHLAVLAASLARTSTMAFIFYFGRYVNYSEKRGWIAALTRMLPMAALAAMPVIMGTELNRAATERGAGAYAADAMRPYPVEELRNKQKAQYYNRQTPRLANLATTTSPTRWHAFQQDTGIDQRPRNTWERIYKNPWLRQCLRVQCCNLEATHGEKLTVRLGLLLSQLHSFVLSLI
jgi:hypothetical protein